MSSERSRSELIANADTARLFLAASNQARAACYFYMGMMQGDASEAVRPNTLSEIRRGIAPLA
jgi:hypothetical protein